MGKKKSLANIAREVSAAFHVPEPLMLGSSRRGMLPQARDAYTHLGEIAGYSLVEIACSLSVTPMAVMHKIRHSRERFDRNPLYGDWLTTAAEKLSIADTLELVERQRRLSKAECQRFVRKKTVRYHPPFIRYTYEDEVAMRRAIAEANKFMESYGKGEEPRRYGNE